MNMRSDKPRFSQFWNDRIASSKCLQDLGSVHFGVAPAKFEITYNSQEVRSHYIGVRTAAAQELLGTAVNHSNGGGSFNRSQALMSGIAETVERYSAAYVPESGLTHAPYAQLSGWALNPVDFALFSERQLKEDNFPYVPFGENISTAWTVGLDLKRGMPVYVPAQLVYLNRHFGDCAPIGYATSNGLACGPNYTEAAVSALLECAERDAVMIAWNAGLSMPKIDLSSDSRVADLVARLFAPTGLNFVALDLTSLNKVPTSLAVVWSHDTEKQQLSVGAASRSNLSDACIEALLEAFHCSAYCRQLIRDHGAISSIRDLDSDVVTLEDHVRFYGSAEHIKCASFLLASSETTDLRETESLDANNPANLLQSIVNKLASQTEISIVDVTSPDIYGQGLSVIKAVCPSLIPLGVGWRTRYIGGERLLSIPEQRGHRNRRLSYEDLTPYPHPFP